MVFELLNDYSKSRMRIFRARFPKEKYRISKIEKGTQITKFYFYEKKLK